MAAAAQSDRILRAAEVAQKVGLSITSIYSLIRDGTFPRQLSLTKRCKGWRESEVDTWIAGRK